MTRLRCISVSALVSYGILKREKFSWVSRSCDLVIFWLIYHIYYNNKLYGTCAIIALC